MYRLSILRSNVSLWRHRVQPADHSAPAKRYKITHCDVCLQPPDPKPCFDHRNLLIELAHIGQAELIKSFLYTQYWPREPSVVGLWMNMKSPYLNILSEKYSSSGDRYLAFEITPKTKEGKLVGVSVCKKLYPWTVPELEQWAHYTPSTPERHRMYFIAHCLKHKNLFAKYNVDYIYSVEVLATSEEVSAQGVGTRLLQNALKCAEELRHPLVQVLALNEYMSRICLKCDMKREWSMRYSEFVDDGARKVFYPRHPHHYVRVYSKYFDPAIGARIPCRPPFL